MKEDKQGRRREKEGEGKKMIEISAHLFVSFEVFQATEGSSLGKRSSPNTVRPIAPLVAIQKTRGGFGKVFAGECQRLGKFFPDFPGIAACYCCQGLHGPGI